MSSSLHQGIYFPSLNNSHNYSDISSSNRRSKLLIPQGGLCDELIVEPIKEVINTLNTPEKEE